MTPALAEMRTAWSFDLDGQGDGLEQPGQDLVALVGVVEIDGTAIIRRPQPGQGVAVPQVVVLEAGRDLDEEFVAAGVPEGVVDLLEAVEVEVNHGHRLLAPPRLDRRLAQAVGQEDAVGQSR